MIVNQVKVEIKRTLPSNQWEYDIVSLDASLEEGDTVSDVIQVLKRLCLQEHLENIKGGSVVKEKVQLELPIETKKEEVAVVKVEEVKKEEAKPVEKKAKAKPETKVTPKPLPEEVKEKIEPKVEEKKEVKKATKLKNIVYDRSNDLHKNHVGKLLDSFNPKWRSESEQAAVAASKGMAGQDFMDSEGNILDSFKDGLMKIFNDNR